MPASPLAASPTRSGPERLFKPLFEALQHNPERRPANGAIFADRLESALNS
jgi:hypothetical protein